ncbi:conserved hypothetical protein [Aspergillus fumigatus A1163]|uniref:Uncharacterized protein n=1 Tax=Aspergillus fumigatus (strain CBS 144.89 / FGSC A1163 / CEA10) TaxID=451804 RepID=B0Y0E2_ASPFC|nr:conserved hypothetical protein [Aspergillus fumigatus A1163]
MRLAVGVSSAVVHIATAITPPQLGGADRTTNYLAESSVIDSGGASELGIELYVCRMSTFYPSHCMLQETWNSSMPRDVNALQPQFELSVHHFCPEMELSLELGMLAAIIQQATRSMPSFRAVSAVQALTLRDTIEC